MKTFKVLGLLVALLFAVIPLEAQTATVQTTLTNALTQTTGTQTFAVASTTGMTASGNSTNFSTQAGGQTFIAIDNELMLLTAVNSSTSITVRRAIGGIASPHPSGGLVWWGPGGQWLTNGNTSGVFISGTGAMPSGSCTATSNQYLPVLSVTPSDGVFFFHCPNSKWTRSKLNPIQGNERQPYTPKTASYTALLTDYIIAYTSLTGAVTVTLPTITGTEGKIYIIRNESSIATNTIWVTGVTIDGSAASNAVYGTAGGTQTDGVIRLYSNGTGWFTW